MADMADFALEQVCDEEVYRAEAWYAGPFSKEAIEFEETYGYQPKNPIRELDVDVFDPDSDFKFTSLEFDNLFNNTDTTRSFGALKIKNFREQCKKYEFRWKLIHGMTKTVWYYNKNLSDKQFKWMETNYKGGTSQFLMDLKDEVKGELLMYNITKFYTFIKEFGNGSSWTVAHNLAIKFAENSVEFGKLREEQ